MWMLMWYISGNIEGVAPRRVMLGDCDHNLACVLLTARMRRLHMEWLIKS